MPERLSLSVISDPVAKARARVAVRGGRAHAYTPRKTENAEWQIRTSFITKYPTHKPLTGPIDIDVSAYLRMPASMPKKQRATARPVTRPDADNYLKTVLDALNGVAFADDSQVVSASIEKAYAAEGVAPFWHIEIYALTPQPAATPGVEATNGDSAPAGIR